MATPQYHFGRRETPKVSVPTTLYEHFNLNCRHCGNLHIHARLERGEDQGDAQLYLWCPTCNHGEAIPLR